MKPELIRLALFGSPIKASLSPRIHRAFAAQFGLEIEFQRIETTAEDFSSELEAFRLAGGVGCNVTLPLKQDAWRLAGDSTTGVRLAQAANTLVYQQGVGWFAHNTDGVGLVADLTVSHRIELSGHRLLILGAGGAVAGILGSLLAAAPQEIMLVNRNLERAEKLAQRFGSHGNVTFTSWQDISSQGGFDLIINATSLGHQGEAPELMPSLFAPAALCYDLNYYLASQPLKKLCGELARPYIDGLGMLVEQAAKSFYLWTGKRPDTEAVVTSCRAQPG